tara:strand:+ start:244 stop:492 length:249 start_codon:yes stop_codon:yes gene_type:complete
MEVEFQSGCKKKHHKIITIQDVLDATDGDNIDNFLQDLKLIMLGAYLVRDELKKQGSNLIFSEPIEWIDDGKHDIKIELQEK